MASEEQKAVIEEHSSEAPSEQESAVGEVQEELSEREVFTGDEDFYNLLSGQGQAQDITNQPHISATRESKVKRFSTLQKALAGSIIVIAVMLLYTLLRPYLHILAGTQRTPVIKQTLPMKAPNKDITQLMPQQTQKPQSELTPTQPLSLKVAQDLYQQADYEGAYNVYNQLHQSLPSGDEEQLLKDFLKLRMALCLKKEPHVKDLDEANRLFRIVSQSRSPVLRILANYELCFIEIQKEQYLKVRVKAYQTIALIDAVDLDDDLALLLQRDCHFLIAESITRNILSLCDADKDLPSQLWSSSTEIDPFSGFNEASALNGLLNSGIKRLSKGLLSPQVQKIEHPGPLPRWSVICQAASIEELLARFAANAGLDVVWAFGGESKLQGNSALQEQTKNAICQRSVSLYLRAAPAQQIVSVAAGCAGLMARLNGQEKVSIFNPDEYCSLSEQISLIGEEAISLWQRFLLTFYNDQRIPNAHFALGLLQEQKDRVTESIAEYKYVANCYPQTPLAPYALLNSSKQKANLHDYSGAREDLKQLVEQYPDSELSSQACLYLADATMKAGFLLEAARLYCKVYNLGLSNQLMTVSALGAGKCFYEKKDYETAAEWLILYINLAKGHADRDLYLAYFLLGKTNLALGNTQQACDAFQYALAGELSKEEYLETALVLVEAKIQQGNFIEALGILENMHSWQFSQKESVDLLLLKCKILRTMGLFDKAIAALGDRTQYIADPQLKARLSFELNKCYIAKGNLKPARNNLTEILVLAEPGPLAHEVALELADVCLKLGEDSKTISICLQLLDSEPSEQIKQETLKILATAYNRQKNYDQAALSLLGKWNQDKDPNDERTPDSPAFKSRKISETR